MLLRCSGKIVNHGRAMEGLSVYVHLDFVKYVTRIFENCSFGVIFKVDKKLFNSTICKTIILAFIYLPPNESHFYDNKTDRGIKLLETFLFELSQEYDYEPIIYGDP